MQTETNSIFKPKNRIWLIDLVRGFAIFGIFMVNMEFFNYSVHSIISGTHQPTALIDQATRFFVMFFGEGKFYSIFSMLFGIGMMMQYENAQSKGIRFVPFYLRRMLALLVFGLIHAYLIWPGDILVLYSICGVITLLFFRNRKPKTLLVWTIIFLLIPLIINAGLFALIELGKMTPEGAQMMEEVFAQQANVMAASGLAADQAYATGSFLEVTRQRFADMNFMISLWPFMGFNVLAMFTLGIYAGKRKLYEMKPEDIALFRKVWPWALVIGIVGNLLYVVFAAHASRTNMSLPLITSLIGQTFGAPALGIFYATSLILLAQRQTWEKYLRPIANVGQMGMTNYLSQSVIGSILFYGYGFGLYGIGVAAGLVLVVFIYSLQVIFSGWWLKRFLYGPMEWLWRTLSYLKRQPMRR